jgi:hypothetical protein
MPTPFRQARRRFWRAALTRKGIASIRCNTLKGRPLRALRREGTLHLGNIPFKNRISGRSALLVPIETPKIVGGIRAAV